MAVSSDRGQSTRCDWRAGRCRSSSSASPRSTSQTPPRPKFDCVLAPDDGVAGLLGKRQEIRSATGTASSSNRADPQCTTTPPSSSTVSVTLSPSDCPRSAPRARRRRLATLAGQRERSPRPSRRPGTSRSFDVSDHAAPSGAPGRVTAPKIVEALHGGGLAVQHRYLRGAQSAAAERLRL